MSLEADRFTIAEHKLDVGDGHELHVEVWGNENAERSFVHLHGGPGSGTNNKNKDYFDPTKHLVAFFDQRGSGLSTPYGSLENNSTSILVEDINKVADYADLDRFGIVGGSWGSCLALLYAIEHPQRVEYMLLHGVFTARQQEIDYLYKGGYRRFFPEVWDDYIAGVPVEHRDNPGEFYLSRAIGEDTEVAKSAAYQLDKLGAALVSLDQDIEMPSYEDYDPSGMLIQCSYDINGMYLPDNYIMDNAPGLTMPVDIVQGRYDMICPPTTAIELHHRLPQSDLALVMAGHLSMDAAKVILIQQTLRNGYIPQSKVV